MPHPDRRPIHYAAIEGHLTVVQSLVEDHNEDIMCVDSKGHTPLYLATLNDWFEVVKYLLEAGADVNNGGRMPPLILAVVHYKPELCKFFLSYGADVNLRDNFGRSPLGTAARTGSVNIACELIQAGADVNLSSRGGTPFLSASRFGKVSMMRLLSSQGADVEACDQDGDTALHLAVGEGYYRVVRYLTVELCVTLNAVNNNGETAFFIALKKTDIAVMQLLIKVGYWPVTEMHRLEINSASEEFKLLSDIMSAPYSLQELACFKLRRTMGSRVTTSVNLLPVPQPVKEFILLRHLPFSRP
ncbi:ankyrin repeat and protein kinase domain-containing protein 1-like [Haliotis rufescens]|uniref:ankyrin repeat and protein kinase domain-containing protein 1-like n=1 Tax=Haliotis rufescens TaxID=6454 RepID=UPI001EAFBA9D|nr:ankyrin repeat and protein kinase domain-containing protein 1-like [Haliotis rufescens]